MSRQIGENLTVEGDIVNVLDDLAEGGAESLTWRGHFCWKNPVDLIIYAEIIHEVRPTLVIETGSHSGGSALFWLDMMRLNQINGEVFSVDLNPRPNMPVDQNLTFLGGMSSTDAYVTEAARAIASRHERVLVNLDSNHLEEHVSVELDVYHKIVTPGSYMIVEDGIDDFRWRRRGPYAACLDFLRQHPEYERDLHRERLKITNCPAGFLKRLK